MQRDMDLVRKILLAVEAYPSREPMAEIELPPYTDDQLFYHLDLLRQAGLIHDAERKSMQDAGGIGLTWAGHEFLDNARDSKTWNRVRKALGKKSSEMSFAVLNSTLIWLLQETAKGNIKIPLP